MERLRKNFKENKAERKSKITRADEKKSGEKRVRKRER